MTHLRFRDVWPVYLLAILLLGGATVVLFLLIRLAHLEFRTEKTSVPNPGLVRIQDIQNNVTCYRIENYEGIACLHDEPDDGGTSQ